jgi:hypothetical protein
MRPAQETQLAPPSKKIFTHQRPDSSANFSI